METILHKTKKNLFRKKKTLTSDVNLILYTFDNITNFNKDFLTTTFDIKFISYGDNQLKVIFNNALTNEQEFQLLDTLNKI
jgi:viroplasmin and RNaseH domain-containing protein